MSVNGWRPTPWSNARRDSSRRRLTNASRGGRHRLVSRKSSDRPAQQLRPPQIIATPFASFGFRSFVVVADVVSAIVAVAGVASCVEAVGRVFLLRPAESATDAAVRSSHERLVISKSLQSLQGRHLEYPLTRPASIADRLSRCSLSILDGKAFGNYQRIS